MSKIRIPLNWLHNQAYPIRKSADVVLDSDLIRLDFDNFTNYMLGSSV
jgi:hypothetical protein